MKKTLLFIALAVIFCAASGVSAQQTVKRIALKSDYLRVEGTIKVGETITYVFNYTNRKQAIAIDLETNLSREKTSPRFILYQPNGKPFYETVPSIAEKPMTRMRSLIRTGNNYKLVLQLPEGTVSDKPVDFVLRFYIPDPNKRPYGL